MAKTEVVLCRGWRGASAFLLKTLRQGRDRDPLAPARTAVLLPTASAIDLFRTQLEDAFLSRGSATLLPSLATASSLVELMAGRTAGAVRLADPLVREALLERAFEKAQEEGARPPFAVRSGLSRRVLDLHDEILARSPNQGIDRFFARALEELDVPDDEGASKLTAQTRFLRAAIEEYRRSLDALGLVDPPGARSALRGSHVPFERVLVLGTETLEPLDLELLESASTVTELTIAATEPASEIPEALARVSAVRADNDGGEPPRPPRLLATATGEISFTARDREESLVDVARLLKLLEDEGRLPPLHRVAVVVPHPLPYLYLAKKVLAESGVPYRLQDSFPLAREPYVAAVDLVLELVASGGRRDAALALLRSPFFAFSGVSGWHVAALDQLTLRYREPGGWERWRSLHQRWSRPPLQPALPGIDSGDATERARVALAALLSCAEALTELREKTPFTVKLECLRRFLASRAAPPPAEGEEDASTLRARAGLHSILDRLSEAYRLIGDPPFELPEFRERLRRAIEAHTFAIPTGEDGVAVLDARSAPFGAFDLVVLLGLNEGEWPARGERNIFYPQWLLRDFGFRSDRELLALERRRFTGLLELSGKLVVLFRHHLEEEIPTVASPFLEDLRSWIAENDAPIEPLTSDLSRIVVSRGEALRRRLLAPEIEAPPRRPGRVSAPLAVPEPVSPTALELYLRCPFKYFSRHLLGLEEEEEVEDALTPLERGRILHELLQQGFAEWDRGSDSPRPIDPESYDQALALFRRVALSRIPLEHRSVEIERLFGGAGEPGAIAWLLRREMSRLAPRQRLLEHPFQAPLRIEEGPRGEKPWYLRIKGRVDRADVDRDGSLHVIDYKSGRAPAEAVTLQVPLYAMCLSSELGAPVREASYLSFRDRKAVSRADFAKAIELLVASYRAIQEGVLSPRPHQDHLCRSCGFALVCRREIVEAEA